MPKESKKSPSNIVPPRPRGRPLKECSNPAIELQRARVRRAQKAFRTRKEQRFSMLESKCQTLEKVVEEMTNTFITFSDGLLRIENVEKELDGRVKRELRGTIERFLELGRRAARDVDKEEDLNHVEEKEGEGGDYLEVNDGKLEMGTDETKLWNAYESSLGQFPSSGGTPPFQDSFTPASSFLSTDPYPQPEGLTQLDTTSLPTFPPPESANTTPSLYLNNIWSHAPSSNPKPTSQPTSSATTSAIPYILAGRSSFATHLYFATISIAVRSLRGEAPASFAKSFFRYKFLHVSPLKICGVVDGILNMLLHGTSQIKDTRVATGVLSEQGECENEEKISAATLKYVESTGERKEEYFGSWDVERYLKTKWRLTLDSNRVSVQPRAFLSSQHDWNGFGKFGNRRSEDGYGSAAVDFAAPTIIPGFEHTTQRMWDASELVNRLLAVAVSIGEGPRWHFGQIDAVVEAFLMENRVSR